MLKKVIAYVLVSVLCLTIVSACGNGQGNQETSQGAAANAGTIDIKLFHRFGPGEARQSLMQETLKKFKEKYPNINVQEEIEGSDSYDTKFKTTAASGDVPDVFLMRGPWAKDLSNLGVINPLDDIINADPDYKNAFKADAFSNSKYNGKIYSVPLSTDLNSLVFYNKAMFDKYNLTFPQTWDELLNVIKVFKSNNIIPIAVGNKATWLAECSFLGLFIQRAGGTDFAQNLLTGDAKFTDPPYVEALNRILELVNAGAFNSDVATIDNFQQEAVYGQGKSAMFVEGTWAISALKQTATDEIFNNTEIGMLPPLPGGKGDTKTVDGGSGWGWSIGAKLTGAKKDAAIKLLKALSDKDWASNLITMANMLPVVKDVQYDQSKVPPLITKTLTATQGFSVSPVPDQVLDPQIETELEKTLAAVMGKSMTPEEAAQKVQAVKDKVSAKK